MADAPAKAADPRWAWAPYRPSAEAPWDLRRVGHLYRRAAFGATSAELDAGLKAGPEKAVEALLAGGPGQEEVDRATALMAGGRAPPHNRGPPPRPGGARVLGSPPP